MANYTLPRCIGVIGGLGAHAGADVHAKLLAAITGGGAAARCQVLFERQRFEDEVGSQAIHGYSGRDNEDAATLNARKLFVFDMAQRLVLRGADSIVLPCFVSHTFLRELQEEVEIPIIDVMHALLFHLHRHFARPGKVGVLTGAPTQRMFNAYFAPLPHKLLYPDAALLKSCVEPAVHGPHGLRRIGPRPGSHAMELLGQACSDLLKQGADVVVPGCTDIAMAADALRACGFPVIDSNQIYADYALAHRERPATPRFKLGIVGGVGPAATVDFMDKIIRNTAARCDQDHIQLVVEHKPTIPDRTANLIGNGDDPTLALYSACKRLEINQAAAIAIPCNTAHAYVKRIEHRLSVPIVHMPRETVAYIGRNHPDCRSVGLLATSGTLACGIYQEAAAGAPFTLIVPDARHQTMLMSAIYGEHGAKAGYTTGRCREELLRVVAHLAERGAGVIVLGCTELPLLLDGAHSAPAATANGVALVDPADILARRCVALARANGTPVSG